LDIVDYFLYYFIGNSCIIANDGKILSYVKWIGGNLCWQVLNWAGKIDEVEDFWDYESLYFM
jgi:hypothetical protein